MPIIETDICNLALSHLNESKELTAFRTDKTENAKACLRFYDQVLYEVLSEYPWPFTTKFDDLVEVAADPTEEWAFSYRYPTDCLHLRRIRSGTRNDNRQTRVPYRIGQDGTGELIYTDKEDAACEYTVSVTDPAKFPKSFVAAFSLLLAGYIAPRVTGGDPFKLGERAFRLYSVKMSDARATLINEEQDEELPESQLIRERE